MSDPLQDKMARIVQAVNSGLYRYTIHGAQQRIARHLTRSDIEATIGSGEVIEDYPTHHYGPCSLILGKTAEGKALHVLCSNRSVVDIITVYEPDPNDWEPDLKTRKQQL